MNFDDSVTKYKVIYSGLFYYFKYINYILYIVECNGKKWFVLTVCSLSVSKPILKLCKTPLIYWVVSIFSYKFTSNTTDVFVAKY